MTAETQCAQLTVRPATSSLSFVRQQTFLVLNSRCERGALPALFVNRPTATRFTTPQDTVSPLPSSWVAPSRSPSALSLHAPVCTSRLAEGISLAESVITDCVLFAEFAGKGQSHCGINDRAEIRERCAANTRDDGGAEIMSMVRLDFVLQDGR